MSDFPYDSSDRSHHTTPIDFDVSELLPVVRYIIALNTEIDRLRAENDRLAARCGDTGVAP